MTDYQIGDEQYVEEVNTTYDQEQPIGDTPSDYPAGGAEPIDAKTGQDFLDIDWGEEFEKVDRAKKAKTKDMSKSELEEWENGPRISDMSLDFFLNHARGKKGLRLYRWHNKTLTLLIHDGKKWRESERIDLNRKIELRETKPVQPK